MRQHPIHLGARRLAAVRHQSATVLLAVAGLTWLAAVVAAAGILIGRWVG